MTRFAQDLRYAARQLGHARGFTVIAVLTLALGIGGNTVFFAAVNAMVFRPIRAAKTDGLFVVELGDKRRLSRGPLTGEQFRRLESNSPAAVSRMGAMTMLSAPVIVAIPGRAERVDAEVVTGGYAAALDLTPQAGRLLVPEDDTVGAAPVVVVSDRLWREWFDGDHAPLGRTTIRINGQPFTLVGVAPRGFRGRAGSSYGTADVWVPAAIAPQIDVPGTGMRTVVSRYWTTFVLPRSANERIAAESGIRTVLTTGHDALDPAFTLIRLYSAGSFIGKDRVTSTGFTIIALAGLLLVAACANVANMLFARGAQRAAEVAVRLSLGASRGQIFRLFLLETTLVAAMAAIAGMLLAIAATSVLGAAFPSIQNRNFRLFVDLTPDYRVFLFALGAGAIAAVAVGVVTAWRASGVTPHVALASSAAGVGATRRGHTLRLGLVALQVTAAVLLLMGAGLYLRMTAKALDQYVEFDTTPLTTAVVNLRLHDYHETAGRIFFDQLLDAVRRLPDVERAALADGFPGGSYSMPRSVDVVTDREVKEKDGTIRRIDGYERKIRAGYVGVTPGLPDTIGMPVLRGRDIAATDQDTTPDVALVSESVARLLWPGQDPIGQHLMFGRDGHVRTVVGVTADPVQARVESPLVSPANLVLIPAAQSYRPEMLVVVRSARPRALVEAIRSASRAIDENVAVFDAAPADDSIMSWAAPLHAAAILSGSLGLLALTIATLGVYGVLAYVVSLRTREFGIRMALGARPGQVIRLVVDDAIHLLLVGLLAGVFVTAIAERYFQSQRVLFMPNEISTWAGVLLMILGVGLVAAYLPARRASLIDPNIALRNL